MKTDPNWIFLIPIRAYTFIPVNATAATRERVAFIEVTAAMALAGSTVVAGKILGSHLPVFTAVLLTFVFALAAGIPLQLTRLRELTSLPRRELLLMALQALFGMVLFRVFTLYGLRFTSAVNAGIITSSTPAMTVLLARVVFREGLGVRRAASVALTCLGIAVVTLGFGGSGSGGSAAQVVIGNLLLLGAVVSESLLTIFRKLSPLRVSSVTNTTVLCLISSLLILPFAASEWGRIPAAAFTRETWLAAAYYGSFATLLAYLLWGDGALHIPAGRVGIATGAMPIAACLLSWLVLGESFGVAQIVGCGLAAAGMLLGNRR